MKNKAKINLGVDIVIGLSFLVAAVSGVILLFAGSGGFQGGRNPAFTQTILFLSRNDWKLLHDWSAVIMIIGTFVHLIFHWNWITCMIKNMLRGKNKKPKSAQCEL